MADSMQFNLEKDSGGYLIQKYDEHSVTIDERCYDNSLIIFPDRIVDTWSIQTVESLTIESLQAVIDAKPEVFLLGTGRRQQFPPLSLMGELAKQQRSIDVMDMAAACRTYNVLASEFRQVVVALILPAADAPV